MILFIVLKILFSKTNFISERQNKHINSLSSTSEYRKNINNLITQIMSTISLRQLKFTENIIPVSSRILVVHEHYHLLF